MSFKILKFSLDEFWIGNCNVLLYDLFCYLILQKSMNREMNGRKSKWCRWSGPVWAASGWLFLFCWQKPIKKGNLDASKIPIWIKSQINISPISTEPHTYLYRVSHGKVNKVIWLCWQYRFWFLLIFFILHVHEIWPFMPNS